MHSIRKKRKTREEAKKYANRTGFLFDIKNLHKVFSVKKIVSPNKWKWSTKQLAELTNR